MTEEALFLAALDRSDPAERQAFLRQECGDDAALYHRVEQLLAAYAAGQDHLEPPTGPAREFSGRGVELATEDHRGAAAAGTVIAGRYRLLERIGEGGMGEVWVARQTEPVQRKVAVKLIRADRDSRQVVARFEAERQALALMDHPSIARVLDGGTTEAGRPFFVMELVNGLALTKFCDEAKLTPRQRLALFVPICQAVQHAHQKGIIHRDLKPSNILVTLYDGRPVPKIIDFGVAKATGGRLTDESLATQFGAVVGTFEYMAPEQAGFSALDVDTRADVYSLGVILYELLTGLRPFDSQRLRQAALDEAVRILREEEPPRPSTRVSTDASAPALAQARQTDARGLARLMRGELDWVVMKCLEKDRTRRYETANGLGRDIQRYLADEPVEARAPSAGYRLRKLLRRNRGAVVAVGAFVLLLLAATAVSLGFGLWAEAERGRAVEARQQASDERDEAEKQRRRAKENEERAQHSLYVANMNRVRFEMEHNNVERARALLDLYRRPAGAGKDRRGWEWYYWDRMCQGELYTIKAHEGGGVGHIAFSPDGALVATASRGSRSTVKLWDTVTGREFRSWPSPFANGLAFGPDGRMLAISGSGPEGSLDLWEVSSGKRLERLKPDGKGVLVAATFSPDGRTLSAYDTHSRRVRFRDVAGGKWFGSLPSGPSASLLRYSPDGRTLAVVDREGASLWDIPGQKRLHRITGHSFSHYRLGDFLEMVTGVAFSPDGRSLATCGRDGTAKLHEVRTGKHLRTMTAIASGYTLVSGLNAIAFSPDGRSLIAGGQQGLLRSWEVSTGREELSFLGHAGDVLCLAISPDGARLASGSSNGEIKLWDATASPAQGHSLSPSDLRGPSAFTADGARMVHVPSVPPWLGGEAVIQDLSGGKPARLLPIPGYTFALSPDGERIATIHRPIDRAAKGGARPHIWHLNSGRVERAYDVPAGPPRPIQQLSFSPDGKALGYSFTPVLSGDSSGPDETVTVLDLASGRAQRFPGTAVAFSPDGRKLAIAARDRSLRVIDRAGGRVLARLQARGSPSYLRYSPDGLRLFFGGAVWDAASGRQICALESNDVVAVFSPDGKRLFSTSQTRSSSGHLRVWDAATGDLLLAIRVPGDSGLAVHPDGLRCAVTSLDTGTWLIDARPLTPQLRRRREAHNLVAHLFRRPMLKEEILPFLRGMKTISEDVRRDALALADRQEGDARWLNLVATETLSQSSRTLGELRQAARWAKEAHRLAPARGDFANTYGAALYYAREYPEAEVVLERSLELNRKYDRKQLTYDYIFLAMTRWQLGRPKEAKAVLDLARDPKTRYWGVLPHVWREAEALIEGKKR
jgi:WD40 repeat protein/serine/threonine protein kinase